MTWLWKYFYLGTESILHIARKDAYVCFDAWRSPVAGLYLPHCRMYQLQQIRVCIFCVSQNRSYSAENHRRSELLALIANMIALVMVAIASEGNSNEGELSGLARDGQ